MKPRGIYCLSILVFACGILAIIQAAPTLHQPSKVIPGASENEIEENVNDIHADDNVDKEIDDLGLEYGRYLQEIVKALDDDPVFSKKLENVTHEQIMNGHVAQIIDQVHPDIRNRLDELKRVELDRLRKLAMQEHKLEEEIEAEKQKNDGAYEDMESGRRWRTTNSNRKQVKLGDETAGHLNHANPHTFEAEDLQKLILKATKDLDELDKKRRRDFKQYEMEKEIHYRESLQNMTAEEKQKAEKEHEEMKRKAADHPKVHHPGSKQQFEEVWEQQDHMPRQEFDPKTFFQMHDLNGDGFLDQEEVEAILTVEVKKMYNEKDPNFDRNVMMEEYHRMREHIYREIDANRDGLISKKEFLDYTHQEQFQKDDGWKGLEEAPVYTEEELRQYEKERMALAEHYARYGAYGYPPGPGGNAMHPGQFQQQQQMYYQVQHPNQGYQQHPGQQQQQYVVHAAPEHIQQPVQYQHVQLPPQTYQQQQQHPSQQYQQQPQIAGGQQHPPQHQQMPAGGQPPPQHGQMPVGGQPPPQHGQMPQYGQIPQQHPPQVQQHPPQGGNQMPNQGYHPPPQQQQPHSGQFQQPPMQQQHHPNAQPPQQQHPNVPPHH